MHFEVLQENLKKSLSYLQKIIPSKAQFNALSAILIEVADGKLRLSGTDLYLGIRTELTVKSEGEGKLLIEAETFRSMISSLEAGMLEVSQEDGFLAIKQGKTKAKLSLQNGEEFPEFPEVKGDSFDLKAEDLIQINELVSFAAGTDQTRPVLTSTLMNFKKDSLEVVATDGFRLSKLDLKDISTNQDYSGILIPTKALVELHRILKQSDEDSVKMIVSFELKQVLFELSHLKMYVRLVDGDYPPFEKIIPSDFLLKVEFDAQEFLTQLRRATVFSKGSSSVATVEISDQELIVSSISAEAGEYSGSISITNPSAESGKIAFNITYLIDFVNALKPETIVLQMNESLKPAMFSDKNRDNHFYIAMPFRISE
jgi:DNA polymerase-3 subunit beta